MASTTTNLGLTKPASGEAYSIDVVNGNTQKIDDFAGECLNATMGGVASINALKTLLDSLLVAMPANGNKSFQFNFTSTEYPFTQSTYMCTLYKSQNNTTFATAEFRRIDRVSIITASRNSNGWTDWTRVVGLAQVVDISSQTNITSGKIYLVKVNNIRQLVVVDAVLPASDLYLTLPQMTSVDQPAVSTEGILRRYDYSLHFIWLRASGTWGQANGKAGATLNGNLVWLVG